MKSIKIHLAISFLLSATLACNISSPQGPSNSTPEVVTILATATSEQPADALTENASNDQTSPDDGSKSDGESSDVSGESVSISPDGIIRSSVSVKDGDASFDGSISFPGEHTNDDITVKPIGFDGTKESGYLTFNLSCSGQGNAKVNYKGGMVVSGSPACGESWKIYVINGSPDSHINIRLDASGEVNWALAVTAASE